MVSAKCQEANRFRTCKKIISLASTVRGYCPKTKSRPKQHTSTRAGGAAVLWCLVVYLTYPTSAKSQQIP
ncbi:hypothetical protein GHT06_014695 [Daphnia sinensis]|uniref:Uncharacterized protein n=1 Tax=Daphnia sinensis TaxID=1820382 RepID=A0AAD5LHS0_9CRUS|nr:hypothetical protein GHT06_014695 [Daphnia sinensis]